MSLDDDKDRKDIQHQQDKTCIIENNPNKISKQILTIEAHTYTPNKESRASTIQFQKQQENKTKNYISNKTPKDTHNTNKGQQIVTSD